MPIRFTRRAALTLGAVAVSGALLAFTPLSAGYSYTFRVSTRTTDAKGKVKDETPTVAKVQVAGDRARMDFETQKTAQGGTGVVKEGGWMMADRAKRTLTIVDPEEKTFSTMPIDAFGQMMGGALGGVGQMLKVKITNPRFSSQDLGSGGVVNGLPTKHYKVTHDYEMDMQILWKKEHQVVHTEAEYWVNDEVKSHANPMFEMMAAIGTSMVASDTVFTRQVGEATKKLFVGVPVRSVSHTTTVNQKNEKTETVSTIEMTDFRRGDVPASVFAMPAGYTDHTVTEADMAKAREEQARAADSAKAANARDAEAEPADSAAAKPSVKDAAKSRLRGVLRRP